MRASGQAISADNAFASAEELLRAGIAAAQAGRRDEAREHFIAAVAEDADDERLWLWLASLAKSPPEALLHVRQALQLNPTNARARELEAFCLERVRRAASGWPCPVCGEAATKKRCPECGSVTTLTDAAALLAGSRGDRGRAAEAALQHQSRLHGQPDAAGFFFLGLALANAGRSREGLAALRRAAELRPGDDKLRAQVEAYADAVLRVEERARLDARSTPRILIVDDSPVLLHLVGATLQRCGYAVLTAGSVPEAMGRVDDYGPPHLIFLDSALTGPEGARGPAAFGHRPETAAVPVVLLSRGSSHAQHADATPRIRKPFRPEQVLQAVLHHCPAANPDSPALVE